MLLEQTNSWRRYGVALAVTALALLLRMGLDRALIDTSPLLIFTPAVMLGAWYGGLGPGLVATAAGALACDYFLLKPNRGFDLDPQDLPRLILFIGVGIQISWLSGALHKQRRRVEADNQSLEKQVDGLERQLLAASEREQQRIGQDLHDGLGPHLAGVGLLSKALAEELAGTAPKSEATARRIATLIEEATAQARALARGLCPVALQSDGLAAALEQLATNSQRLFNIPCRFQGPDVLVPDTLAANHLFRIAQEAVNNAVKHGAAHHVWITLAGQPQLCLTVQDDGVGLPDQLPSRRGMGLHIMQFRADAIDAALTFSPRPAGGTIVTCSMNHPVVSQRRNHHDHTNQSQLNLQPILRPSAGT